MHVSSAIFSTSLNMMGLILNDGRAAVIVMVRLAVVPN